MSDLPDVNPDPQRVINRLSAQLATALAEKAMLEDVVQQLVAERAAAGNATPDRATSDPADR